jgi:hypothetical protein
VEYALICVFIVLVLIVVPSPSTAPIPRLAGALARSILGSGTGNNGLSCPGGVNRDSSGNPTSCNG